jgi:hypothetical protein
METGYLLIQVSVSMLLFDSQSIGFTAVRLNFEVGILLYDGFQSANQCV